MKKILFISHGASRSGAPILILNLAQALHDLYNCKTDFIIKHSGALDNEFRKLGEVSMVFEKENNVLLLYLRKAYRKITKKDFYEMFFSRARLNSYDLIICNTISTYDVLPFVRKFYKGKLVSYIHELKVATDFLTTKETIEQIKKQADLFLVPGTVMQDFLISEYKLPESKVKVLPGFIPESVHFRRKKALQNTFVVGASGTIELRKGTDFFVQLAYHFKKFHPLLPVSFVWKGGNIESLDYKFLQEDVTKLGLADTCSFEASSANMDEFYNSIDLFILPSREDPYPLVMLEAANAEVPSICFENAGGSVEFIKGNGKIVRYLDLESTAEAIIAYYNNREELHRDGKKAKEKLVQIHQNKNKICQQVMDLI